MPGEESNEFVIPIKFKSYNEDLEKTKKLLEQIGEADKIINSNKPIEVRAKIVVDSEDLDAKIERLKKLGSGSKGGLFNFSVPSFDKSVIFKNPIANVASSLRKGVINPRGIRSAITDNTNNVVNAIRVRNLEIPDSVRNKWGLGSGIGSKLFYAKMMDKAMLTFRVPTRLERARYREIEKGESPILKTTQVGNVKELSSVLPLTNVGAIFSDKIERLKNIMDKTGIKVKGLKNIDSVLLKQYVALLGISSGIKNLVSAGSKYSGLFQGTIQVLQTLFGMLLKPIFDLIGALTLPILTDLLKATVPAVLGISKKITGLYNTINNAPKVVKVGAGALGFGLLGGLGIGAMKVGKWMFGKTIGKLLPIGEISKALGLGSKVGKLKILGGVDDVAKSGSILSKIPGVSRLSGFLSGGSKLSRLAGIGGKAFQVLSFVDLGYGAYKGYKNADKYGTGKVASTIAGAIAGGIGSNEEGGVMNAVGNAMKWAAIGATVGSVVPGIGTAIGAGVGALVGGITGFIGERRIASALDSVGNVLGSVKDYIFGGGEEKSSSQPSTMAEATSVTLNINLNVSADSWSGITVKDLNTTIDSSAQNIHINAINATSIPSWGGG